MKKTILFLGLVVLAVFATVAASCNKDDKKDDIEKQDKITGEYTFADKTYPILSAAIRDDDDSYFITFSRIADVNLLMETAESYISFSIPDDDLGRQTGNVSGFTFKDEPNGFDFGSSVKRTVMAVEKEAIYTVDFSFTIDDQGTERELVGKFSGPAEELGIDPR